jgi:hypothetical protein
MSATPETDDQPIIYAMNDNGYQVPCVDLEFARKLERERDEAIRQLENIKASSIHTCHDECQRPMCVLRRERNEARQQLRIAVGLLSTHPQFADKHPEDVLAFVKEGAK